MHLPFSENMESESSGEADGGQEESNYNLVLTRADLPGIIYVFPWLREDTWPCASWTMPAKTNKST